jgi:O-antigen/teichoic acid export membrane protein
MSRFRRFVHGMASSYGALVAGMLYALVSVPLALHYLPKSEFALWAVMTQLVGYIALVELGMTTSVARHLIDQKDRPADGVYGGLIQTGAAVFAVQGLLIFAIAYVVSPLLLGLLEIPPELQRSFTVLLRWQGAVVGFGFLVRIFSQIIYAHQRTDLINYGNILGFALNLLTLWLTLARGAGVFSIIWAGAVNTLVGATLQAAICWAWRMMPPLGAWGRITWAEFRELFGFGRDVFLVALGTQMTTASQAIIVTRTLGLEMAAVWAVCTRLFMFLGELIWRIFNLAEPMLSEMVTRREHDRLQMRFREVVAVTGSVSALAAVGMAVCNDAFVRVWTSGRIFWSPWNDVLLGVWLIVRSVLRCHTVLSTVVKHFGALRYVVFAEGLVFVTLALSLTKWGGVPLMLAISILCAVTVTGQFVTRRTAKYFSDRWGTVSFVWLTDTGWTLSALVPLGGLIWWLSLALPLKWRLACDSGLLGIAGTLIWLRLGIPARLQQDIARRLPPAIASAAEKLLRGGRK